MTTNQTAEIQKIRASYEEKQRTKLEELKALDKRATTPATVFAYIFGSIGALVLGLGMCLAMQVIGNSMPLGIIIGLAGIAWVSVTYPIYKAILKARRSKFSKQIFELSDSLLNV